jgi:predicted TIM-barrel fold metal-dependent hydrolase
MLIVDAQIHIWKSSKPNPNHRQIADYSADDALKEMDEAGVTAAVIHPPGWDPNANALAVEAARQHPNRLAILGNFPLDRPESRSLIDEWKDRPGMLGLRFALLQPHQKTWLSDGTMDWLWPAAERAGLPIALLGPDLLQSIGQIAERHRGLKLMIDHTDQGSQFTGAAFTGVLVKAGIAISTDGKGAWAAIEPHTIASLRSWRRTCQNESGRERRPDSVQTRC